jgi:hypothetical protein
VIGPHLVAGVITATAHEAGLLIKNRIIFGDGDIPVSHMVARSTYKIAARQDSDGGRTLSFP